MKNYFKTFLIGYFFISATNANAVVLKILSSEPDTQVYEVTDPMNKINLGKAPLVINEFETIEPRVLVLEKPGFSTAYIPISRGIANTFSIMATLHPISNWTPDDLTRKSIETAESIVDKISYIQGLVKDKKTTEALVNAENLVAQFPNSISVKLTYANILMMNGDRKKSEAIYATIINEIPESKLYMKSTLEKIRSYIGGSRMPASKKGKKR
jgi:hypothetical protein